MTSRLMRLRNLLRKRSVKMLVLFLIICALLPVVSIIASRKIVSDAADGATYSNVEDVPEERVGLVLGCCRYLANGRQNLYFAKRIRAAAELYKAGKVEYLLVSGDNHTKGYDEATAMKDALVEYGIPEKKIYCDYAGFRTLDSVVRAKKVFGLKRFIVVSQKFHNERAILIAKKYKMDVVGYNAGDVYARVAVRTKLREELARVKAVLDLWVLNKQPHFLGKRIHIGEA